MLSEQGTRRCLVLSAHTSSLHTFQQLVYWHVALFHSLKRFYQGKLCDSHLQHKGLWGLQKVCQSHLKRHIFALAVIPFFSDRTLRHHRLLEYAELKVTHKDHWNPGPGPAQDSPKSHMCLGMLSKCFLKDWRAICFRISASFIYIMWYWGSASMPFKQKNSSWSGGDS